jgi:hypothetical protein
MTIKTHPSALRKLKKAVDDSFRKLAAPLTPEEEVRYGFADAEPTPPTLREKRLGRGMPVRVKGRPQC